MLKKVFISLFFFVIGNYLHSQQWVQIGGDIVANNELIFGHNLDISHDGNTIAIQSSVANGDSSIVSIYQFNVSTQEWDQIGNEIKQWQYNSFSGRYLSLSGDGRALAMSCKTKRDSTVGQSDYVKVLSLENDKWVLKGNLFTFFAIEVLNSIDLSHDGNRIAIGREGQIEVFNYNANDTNWTTIGNIVFGPTDPVWVYQRAFSRILDLSPDGNAFVGGSISPNHKNHVALWKLENGQWVQQGSRIEDSTYVIYSANISPSGNGVILREEDFYFNPTQRRTRYFEFNNTWTQKGHTIEDYALNSFGRKNSVGMNGNRLALITTNENFSSNDSTYYMIKSFDYKAGNWEASADSIGFLYSDYPNYKPPAALSTNGKVIACGYFRRGTNGLVKVFSDCYTSRDTISISSCESFFRGSTGEIFTQNTQFTDTLLNASLCDSLLTINLTILPAAQTQLFDSACVSYFWSQRSIVLDSSGIYYDTLKNKQNCDSIVQLYLTIYNSDTTQLSETACESFYWDKSAQSYEESGLYYQRLTNQYGCDSILELGLQILEIDTTQIHRTNCEPVYWSQTGLNYSVSGIYPDTLSNQNGCDSIVYLNFSLERISVVVSGEYLKMHTVQNTDYTYQWYRCDSSLKPMIGQTNWNYTADTAGSYAVEIIQGNCRDTSACYRAEAFEDLDCRLADLSRLYPNPSNGEFFIDLCRRFPRVNLKIFSTDGRLTYSKDYFDKQQLKVSNISAKGMYVIQLTTEDESKTLKHIQQ